MKRCSNCGIITRDDSLATCQNCGQNFPSVEFPKQPDYNTYQQQPTQNPYQQQFNQNTNYQQQPTENFYQQQFEQSHNNYQQHTPSNTQQTNPNTTYPMYGTQPDYSYSVQPELSMKWYKWMIYGMLFISMLLFATTAYKAFTGKAYIDSYATEMRKFDANFELTPEIEENILNEYYKTFPGIKTSDMFIGVCAIIGIVLAIYVRQQLAHFKKNAPKLLVFLYCYDILTALIYLAWQYAIISKVLDNVKISESVTGSIAISVALAIANYIYLKKREHLFCN